MGIIHNKIMKQLSLPDLRYLRDGQSVTYQIGFFGRYTHEFGEEKHGTLYLVRNKKGEILILTIREENALQEFRQRDFMDNSFVGEEQILKIFID